jgi:Macrocin-O-methyltransferase (TylF)
VFVEERELAYSTLKRVLAEIGSRTPKSVFGRLESALDYLNVGRWMKDHQFSPNYLLKDRRELISTVGKLVCEDEVLYLEFGVWQGDSIRQWSEILKHRRSRLHGFDSFEGLPEDWDAHADSILRKGHFSTNGKLPLIADDRVKFFKGWFEDTLPLYEFIDSPTLVIFLDADLYSSTSYVLKRLSAHIKVGTILYFDEFWDRDHEMKAFDEFVSQTHMSFESLAATYGMRNVAFRRTARTS